MKSEELTSTSNRCFLWNANNDDHNKRLRVKNKIQRDRHY